MLKKVIKYLENRRILLKGTTKIVVNQNREFLGPLIRLG